MTVRAIEWVPGAGTDGRGVLRILDQTVLPASTTYLDLETVDALVAAIEVLAVRGAPALGVAGALGVVVALDEGRRVGWDAGRLDAEIDRVRNARPTAV